MPTAGPGWSSPEALLLSCLVHAPQHGALFGVRGTVSGTLNPNSHPALRKPIPYEQQAKNKYFSLETKSGLEVEDFLTNMKVKW